MHEKPQLSCHSIGGRKCFNFVKYNANGNDFIIIDEKDLELSSEQQLDWLVKRASFLCDRHLGIGADGILLVKNEEAFLTMQVINADGSIAKNCGNGLRCAAQWWFSRPALVKPSLTIELTDRHYLCSKRDDLISIDMGECDIERVWDFPHLSFEVAVYKAYLGNAHLVFVSEVLLVESALAEIKQKYVHWADFNIGFISQSDQQSVVYERGVGFTKSCGSGAIAAALALRLHGSSLSHMTIHQPGGDISLSLYPLVCSHTGAKFRVSQSGGAVEVFRGHISL